MTIIEALGRAFLSLLAFLVFIIGAIYFLMASVDENTIKSIVLKELKDATGQQVEVKGAFHFTFWPVPIVEMKDVNWILKPNSATDIAVQAKALTLQLDVWPFLKSWGDPDSKKELDIDSFKMENVRIQSSQFVQPYQFDQISAEFKNFNTPKKILKEVKIKRNKSHLNGDFVLQNQKLMGEIHSSYFDVKDFPISVKDFSAFLSKSTDMKTQLKIEVEVLQTASLLLKNFKITSKADKGKIILSPLSLELAEGLLQGSVIINNASTQMHIHAKDVILEKLLNQTIGNKGLVGGKTQMTLFATGEGTTLDQILKTLTGRAFFVLKNAKIEDYVLKTSVSQVFFQSFQVLNPLVEKQKHTHIQCAVLRADLKNGMAYIKNNFGLETPEFNVFGNGTLDLQTQAINFQLTNKLKGGLHIEIGKFAKYVDIKGTLTDPKPSFNPQGLIQEGFSLLSGLATGGVSYLAEQIVKMAETNQSACESVMNKKN